MYFIHHSEVFALFAGKSIYASESKDIGGLRGTSQIISFRSMKLNIVVGYNNKN
jgi:hypothetical protein